MHSAQCLKPATILVAIIFFACQTLAQPTRKPVDYVRPIIGTQGEGNTFPGATAPFGMVQFSPDTEMYLWETASGYEYSDSSIIGFSLTHLNGTGIPDFGDFLFTPAIGKPKLIPGPKEHPDSGYRSPYSHADEIAEAGYYRVKLLNTGVQVELTASDRAGLMRLTFPKADSAYILTDLKHVLRWNVVWSAIRVPDDSTITGYHIVNGWGKDRHLYFAARYSKPFDHYCIMNDGKPVLYNGYRFRSTRESFGKNIQFLAGYKTTGQEVIQVKIAISATSMENALKNLDTEIPDWNFERIRNETRGKWDKELSKITVTCSESDKEVFYTSLYHAFMAPNLYQDVDGSYRGFDQNNHKAEGFTNHAVFSLWDTYRATHPLFALIQQKRNADMINSMLAHFDQSVEHLLPVWTLPANETWCMIGYHAVPVIADAFMKDLPGFDAQRAYNAVKTTAMSKTYDNVATYARLGWVPFDKENESVSKTLEYAYDDYCIAMMAKKLKKTDDYNYFMKRAMSYKNLFDSNYQLMRGRDSFGTWRTPFDPHLYVEGGDITEGTSWQYTWYVPQDVPGLINLFGDEKRFVEKLDSLFLVTADSAKGVDDILGRIGEYWHGNEPSHHIIYLYNYAKQPWKTQKHAREILRSQYGNKPNSLCGNDDCGQMSAWYIFSAMGFYPVCPGSNYYALGSPLVERADIRLSNGKTFTVSVKNQSEQNVYIQSVELNGKKLNNPFLPYSEIAKGGTLHFILGSQPNFQWGINPVIPE